MKNIVKTIGHVFKTFGTWIIDHIQGITFAILIVVMAGFYVYTLGYSTNWATIVSETREPEFYNTSQQVNKILSQVGFIGVLAVLISIFAQSHKRKTYFLSNIVLSIFSSIMLVVQAALTLYYNSVLEPMYRAANIPDTLYTIRRTFKNYRVFAIGNALSVIMILTAALVIAFVIYKVKAQKNRAIEMKKAVESYEQ
ncbi:MAG: hypothetical protein RBQ91_01045 [Acholeplasma sp.]|nr:hypothetical protein [Acholeplasma sp.]